MLIDALSASLPAPSSPWLVHVEVVTLGTSPEGLRYCVTRLPLDAGQLPDQAAVATAWPDGPPPNAFCHSTSWRLGMPGEIVVTYAAGPVDLAAPVDLLERPSVVTSGNALWPHPVVMHDHHVVAHAVQHLSELARRDPALGASVGAHGELWAVLHDLAARTPTAEHDEAHEAADRPS